jgi:serine/threonine protein kinase
MDSTSDNVEISKFNTQQHSIFDDQIYDKPWTINDFDIGKKIGKGAKGTVYLAREKRTTKNLNVAIKTVSKSKLDKDSSQRLLSELNNHKSLSHPNIIEFFGWFHDEKKFYIVVEYAYNGDLFGAIIGEEGINEEKAANYIYQLSEALKYMHENKIMHRDIKPENLLLDFHGNLKVCDYGWSITTNKKRKTLCGTPEFLAPEMVQDVLYDQKVDVWSLGVLCFELLLGFTPFKAETDKLTCAKISKFDCAKYKFPSNVSKAGADLICKILKHDPKERISLEEILKHEWILDNVKHYDEKKRKSIVKIEKL